MVGIELKGLTKRYAIEGGVLEVLRGLNLSLEEGAITVVVLNQGLLMAGVNSTIIQAIRGIAFLALVTISQVRPKGLPAPEG